MVDKVRRVNDLIAEMGAATREQTRGIGQVSGTLSQLNQMSQQSAALVTESSAASDVSTSRPGAHGSGRDLLALSSNREGRFSLEATVGMGRQAAQYRESYATPRDSSDSPLAYPQIIDSASREVGIDAIPLRHDQSPVLHWRRGKHSALSLFASTFIVSLMWSLTRQHLLKMIGH